MMQEAFYGGDTTPASIKTNAYSIGIACGPPSPAIDYRY